MIRYEKLSFLVCHILNKYVSPLRYWAKMYAGCIACCPLVSHSENANGTYRRTDARRLHNAFCQPWPASYTINFGKVSVGHTLQLRASPASAAAAAGNGRTRGEHAVQ